MKKAQPLHLVETHEALSRTPRDATGPALFVASVALHPNLDRVGEQAALIDLTEGRRVAITRLDPAFGPPGGVAELPLESPHVSRKAVELALTDGALRVTNLTAREVSIDGRPIGDTADLDHDAARSGFALGLGERVVLWIEARSLLQVPRSDDLGLRGNSEGIVRVRRELGKVLDLDVPVLVRGETGTGKELVAQALHQHGIRRAGPFVTTNLAAVPESMVASELFGHKRGAFTGADRDRAGLFESAHGGTLFLDEIGDIASDVQVALLRVLETGEIQRVGGGPRQRVDVRVVAATDADLEGRIAAGTFREPLYHRLARYVIRLPPLRERRTDIAPLFLHFLRGALASVGEGHRLDDSEHLWIPAALVVDMLRHGWRGNVRELRHFAERVAILNRGEPTFLRPDGLPTVTVPDDPPSQQASARGRVRSADTIPPGLAERSDDDVVRALEAHGWAVRPAARALGMAPNTLYDRKARLMRPATELTAAEIEDALAAADGDEAGAAAPLRVSLRALRARRRDLS